MKVWVVIHHDYDGSIIMAVVSTHAMALDYKARLMMESDRYGETELEIEEWPVDEREVVLLERWLTPLIWQCLYCGLRAMLPDTFEQHAREKHPELVPLLETRE